MSDFQKRFNQLSPTMRWQFNTKAQGYLAPYEGFPDKFNGVLGELFTQLEAADRLKDTLLKGNLSSDYMYAQICASVKSLPQEHMMSGVMGKLAGALAQGDELVYRMCALHQEKKYPLEQLSLKHPCLIQDEQEYQKWLGLLECSELKEFSSISSQWMAPYRKWTQTTLSGKEFDAKRKCYTQAIHSFNVNHLPSRRLPYQDIASNGRFLLDRFSRGRV